MGVQPARSLRASAAPERVVRLGVACRGRIIEERILPSGRPVTVGCHPRSTILLPADEGAPERFELFVVRGGRLHLRLPEGLRGKVDLGDGVVTLARLRAAHPRGAVALPADARGKVQVGEFTLLFHLIPPPPAVARPGRLQWADVDWAFFALVLISSVLHAAAVVWIQAQPPPRKVVLDELPGLPIRIALPPPTAPAPVVAPIDPAATEIPSQGAVTPTPGPEPEPGPPDGALEPPPDSIEAPDAEPQPDPEEHGLLAAMKGVDVLEKLKADPGSLSDDAKEALLAARDPEERPSGGLRGPRHIDGDGVAGIGPITRSPTCCITPPQHRPRPEIPTLEPPPTPVPVLIPELPIDGSDPAPFLRRLHPGFKACYERALKGNPDLTGKLGLSFVTDEASRVTEAWLDTDSLESASVSSCVLKRLRAANLPAEAANLEVSGYSLVFVPR